MKEPRSRIIDGVKFMWDGRSYESLQEAEEAKRDYGQQDFEVRLMEQDDMIEVYTRRVVTEVVVEGEP